MKKILILDDERFVTMLIKSSLGMSGLYEINACTSPLEALEELQRHPYSLLITDIMMPEMDGLSLCTQLRATPGMEKLKIITLSAKRFTPEERTELMAMDVRLIPKPFSPITLKQQILEVLGE